MFKAEIYIEGQRLDLFDDESISIVSSVQKIEDISRTFNDYSQSFTVPASANNNKIFQHWYNFSINNGFDARVRHKAHIDIQSSNFKIGTIRLESCKIEGNKPVHYKLTFFGQLIDLKKVIGDDYLNFLDLSAYDVDYTPANIKTALTTGTDYIVPLISTKRQWFYNNSISSVTFEDRLANIAWNGSAVNHGIDWTSLRPALLVMRFIEGIEQRYGLTFSRDFFDTDVFNGLYLWLANQDTEESLKSRYKVVDYDSFNTFQPAIGSFDNTTGSYTPTASGASKLRQIIFDTDTTDGVLYTIQLMNGDTVLEEKTGTGNLRIDRNIPGGFQQGASIYGRITTSTSKLIDTAYFEIDELSDDEVLNATKTNFTVEGSTANIRDFIPKIKILDFLTSIIKSYNLVIVPNSDTDFYVNTLDAWYSEGKIYDISKYVDTSGVTIDRSKIYREISFNFQEPQTILADEFERTNNTAYGDLETKLKNSDGTALDGGEFEIEVDFEQMVYEKLLNLFNDNETNIVYGLSLDKGLSNVIPEPHLFYGISKSISSNPISFLDDTGTKSQLSGNVWMPSHADSDTHNYSTCFGGEINEHTGGIIQNSLYQRYYNDYVRDSFSIKRRKYKVKARLPLWMLTILKLNDKLIINGDRFIINEMTTDATTQMVDFDLLNDIYNQDSSITTEEKDTPPDEPTPLPGNSFSISTDSIVTSNDACPFTVNTVKYWLGSESQPTLGDVIYNDINRVNAFNGGNLYYKIDGDKTINISTRGIVRDVYFCGQNGGGGNQ